MRENAFSFEESVGVGVCLTPTNQSKKKNQRLPHHFQKKCCWRKHSHRRPPAKNFGESRALSDAKQTQVIFYMIGC